MENLGWDNTSIFRSSQYENFSDSELEYGNFELGGSFTELDYYSSADLDHLLHDRKLSSFTVTDQCHRNQLSSSKYGDILLQNCGTVVSGSKGDGSIEQDSSAFKNGSGMLQNCYSSSTSGESECSETTKARPETNLKRKLDDDLGGFQIFFERSPARSKRAKLDKKAAFTSIDFRAEGRRYEPDMEAIAQVKEMIYRAAALRPVNFAAEEVAERPRRKNVRISSDPQTVAARHRRERISERLRVLQKLVPGGAKMDTASMLDEAASYLKFLKAQVSALETLGSSASNPFNLAPKTLT